MVKMEFIYVDANTKHIRLNKLKQITLPILWNNKGLYGLIPFARIQNEIEIMKDRPVLQRGIFHWHDTIKISSQIANALLGEDKSDECTYEGKSPTKSS